MFRLTVALLLPIIFIASTFDSSNADVIFYDGFNYETGSDSLVGQSGGVGFGGTAWTKNVDPAVDGTPLINVTAAGSIGFSDFATTGGVASIQNNSSAQGHVVAARQLPASFSVVTGSTIYQSYLFRQTESQVVNGVRDVSTSYGSTPLGAPEAVHNRINTAFGFNDPDAIGFGYDSDVTFQQSVYQNQSSVLVINKLENINGTGNQNGTLWMLSEQNYDAIKAGGITEAELDANSIGRIEETVSGVQLNAGDYLQLRTRTQSSLFSNALFDEVKLFTDLSDLQLTPVAVPEPSTGMIFCVAGCVFSAVRRRK